MKIQVLQKGNAGTTRIGVCPWLLDIPPMAPKGK
jgi:hypothetical protein